jgi:hypothetical protein
MNTKEIKKLTRKFLKANPDVLKPIRRVNIAPIILDLSDKHKSPIFPGIDGETT